MTPLRNAKTAARFFGTAGACLLTIALVLSSACGPLCAGFQCAGKSTATEGKSGCHEMAGRTGTVLAAAAFGASCALANGAVAIPGKPVIAERPKTSGAKVSISTSAETFRSFESGIRNAVAFNTTDSPPLTANALISTIVLRV